MTKTVATYTDYHIGHKLKMMRLKNGKSLADISKVLDVSFQQIQKYEKGLNKLSSSNLYALSRYFGIPVTYFFEGMPNEQEEGYDIKEDKDEFIYQPPNNISDSELLVLVRNYSKIKDPNIRRKILDLIKSI